MPQARRNGTRTNPPRKTPVPAEKLQEAARYEDEIRVRAEELRGDANELTPDLFLKLYPLLREPIHEGYLETVSKGDGKPYESTGIRSVQVQHDRMNNVLTPLWWDEVVEYEQDGRLCRVTIRIGPPDGALARRSSWGGVERGSTTGNLYKGSYTNAAKMAFARIGPGREVYIGALDFDPDVSEDAASAQAEPEKLPGIVTIDAKTMGRLQDHYDAVRPSDEVERETFLRDFRFKLGTMGVGGVAKVGEAFAKLTPAQADDLDQWLAAR
jgi:hypothetical protein